MDEKELYTVLLADDEEEVVRMIAKEMNWELLGFRVLGYALNGAEALEMAEELQPDVVMTDIKMPYMDGLALTRELKRRYPDIHILIFSGFDDFEYAKAAIGLEVEEYMLKPVDPGELGTVLARLKERMDKAAAQRKDISRLRDYYMQSLPMLQESFVISLVEGRIGEEHLPKYLASYQMALTGPCYAAALLHVSGARQPDDAVSLLFTVSVRQLAEELMGKYRVYLASYLGDLVMIAQLGAPEQVAELTDTLDLLCRQAKRLYQVPVSAGVGDVCMDLLQIRASYQGASKAVAYRSIYGSAHAISIVEATTPAFVQQAKAYVETHFSDPDITVEGVCHHLGISSSYFSTVFKKETGRTFIHYLTDYRMQQAVELLKTTPDKTYIIARKVGYADSNYFSYVFKKQFGVSPSRYRAQ